MAQGGSNGPWGKRNEWEEVLSRLPHLPKFMKAGIPGFILLIIIAVWAASGIYIVGPGEQGVVRQFGKVIKKTGSDTSFLFPENG